MTLNGGDNEIRTHDPLLARQVLSQLSYTPIWLFLHLIGSGKLNSAQTHTFVSLRMFLAYRFFLTKFFRICFLLLCSVSLLLRKEVIQPHLPIRLPCYDLTPIINPTFGSALLLVTLLTSGVADSHGLTGGVYKTRERIHCSMLTCNY